MRVGRVAETHDGDKAISLCITLALSLHGGLFAEHFVNKRSKTTLWCCVFIMQYICSCQKF